MIYQSVYTPSRQKYLKTTLNALVLTAPGVFEGYSHRIPIGLPIGSVCGWIMDYGFFIKWI